MKTESNWTIYHNPRCSKSREALAYLKEKGIQPDIVEYLKTPPDTATLETLLERLHLEPRDILRTGEDEYDALKLSDPNLSRDALIAAIAENPILMQRPIVVRADRAVVGRPTEAIDSLL